MNVDEIIARCGGDRAIAAASRKGGKGIVQITPWAVQKWSQRGLIAQENWPLLIKLGISLEELYEANVAKVPRKKKSLSRAQQSCAA